jgi:hypothetical protein
MSKQVEKGNGQTVAETPVTQTQTAAAPPDKHIAQPVGELVKVDAAPVAPVQRTFFNLDLFSGQAVVEFDNTFKTNKDGTRSVNGDKFVLMTRKKAADALGVVSNKDNRAMLDKTIMDEGKLAWKKVKMFLMTLPDEWILKRFVLKKKTNGRTSMSLNIEDLEREVIEMEKAAKAWGVNVEDLAEFLAKKKADGEKKATTVTDVTSTVTK